MAPPRSSLEEIALGAHAVMIMHVLRGAVRRLGLDESVRGKPMGAVQRRDVGVSGGAFFIPGPVDKNHNSLHGPPRQLQS